MDLGLQATQSIISSPDPVRTMNEILLNFPKHAPSLSSSRVTNELRETTAWFTSTAASQVPMNSLFINGARVDLDKPTFNIFTLLGLLHKEYNSMDFLNERNLPSDSKKSLINIARSLNEKKSRGSLPDIVRVDVSKGGKYVINFLNNLEKDSMYKRLPRSVKTLLQPSWSLHAIQKNLYTLIGIVDPASPAGASLLYQLNSIFQQQYPIRIGIALACDSTLGNTENIASEDVCRLFAEAKASSGTQAAVNFLFSVANSIQEKAEELFSPTGVSMSAADLTASVKDASITRDELLKLYGDSIAQSKKSWTMSKSYADHGRLVLSEKQHSDFLTNSSLYCKLRGLSPNTFALNGIVRNSYDISSELMQLLGREQYILSMMVRAGQITDSTKSIFTSLLEDSTSFSRYHPIIDDTSPRYIDPKSAYFAELSKKVHYLTNRQDCQQGDQIEGTSLFNTTFLYFPVTKHGITNALSALKWLNSTILWDDRTNVCSVDQSLSFTHGLALIPTTPLSSNSEISQWFSLITHLLHRSCSSRFCGITQLNLLADLFDLFLAEKTVIESINQLKSTYSLNPVFNSLRDSDLLTNLFPPAIETERLGYKSFYQEARTDDDTTVVYNGRVFQIPSGEKTYLDLDFDLIHEIEQSRLDKRLHSIFTSPEMSSQNLNGIDFSTFASFCGTYASSSGGRVNVEEVLGTLESMSQSNILKIHPLFSADEDGDEASSDISLVYVINPLSQSGQRASTLIQYVQKELKLPQTVVFAPETRISEFPLQNFYRFVAGESSVTFKNLPKQHTLTIRMDPPEAWNVQSHRAIQDIDNLKCSYHKCGDIPGHPSESTSVSYIVKNLLIAGQCFEGMDYNPTPPNGLQLVLHSSPAGSMSNLKTTYYSDTLVMQNLGYFQLKANPGLWQLSLAEGRARTLYQIDHINENILKDQNGSVSAVSIPIRSFADKIMRLAVSKRVGMEHLSLLDAEGAAGENVPTMWNSISGMFGLNGKTQTKDTDNRIHVFSLATGQVYERLLRIMMLSVVKRTSSPVKFWLFEYYLSPTFKATVAAMQQEYGFEVGYVMYKWPEWLTQQTVKQRIIWGYKILFLDVLFPLEVKKVIYVDADQVVRADLKELWDMDLEGKPYAYTPFCSTREETL